MLVTATMMITITKAPRGTTIPGFISNIRLLLAVVSCLTCLADPECCWGLPPWVDSANWNRSAAAPTLNLYSHAAGAGLNRSRSAARARIWKCAQKHECQDCRAGTERPVQSGGPRQWAHSF